jgi:hypothetical protein
MITLPQVNPLPNAAKTTVSPDLNFPFSHASVNAIGIEADSYFRIFVYYYRPDHRLTQIGVLNKLRGLRLTIIKVHRYRNL